MIVPSGGLPEKEFSGACLEGFRALEAGACPGKGGREYAIVRSRKMIFSREYVSYLARQTVKQLIDAKVIRTQKVQVLNERVNAALLEELTLEDRINEEVRVILDAYQEDMRRTGASYAEMFKKVKQQLARKYKAVL
jgi:Protein of unknown function (DUF507)